MNKKDELQEIAERMLELFPQLDGVIVEGTVEDPIRIVFMSKEEVIEMSEEYDFEVLEDMDEEYFEDYFFGEDYDDDDDDDDDNGGTKH